MAASGLWSVAGPSQAQGMGVFRASNLLYKGAFGTATGIAAVTANVKSTPVYSIGELVKVGWLVPVNVYVKTGAKTTAMSRVYCSAAKVDDFIAACRTDVGDTAASALTLNSKPIVSASRPRKQSFS